CKVLMLGLILGNLLLSSLLSKAPGETCGPDVPSVRASRSDWLQAPFSWAAQGDISKAPRAASGAFQGLLIMPEPCCLPFALASPAEPHCPQSRGQRACI
ncbi:hypothetical protein H1C71_042377, partial [Ictidomys tridecemlineatus]